MTEFKDMLVFLRKRDHMTQEEAARRIGIPRSTLANYETGKREPDLECLNAIADVYNVNMDTLLCKEEKPAEDIRELSAEEKDLIDFFRMLPKSDQKASLLMIRSLLESKGLL